MSKSGSVFLSGEVIVDEADLYLESCITEIPVEYRGMRMHERGKPDSVIVRGMDYCPAWAGQGSCADCFKRKALVHGFDEDGNYAIKIMPGAKPDDKGEFELEVPPTESRVEVENAQLDILRRREFRLNAFKFSQRNKYEREKEVNPDFVVHWHVDNAWRPVAITQFPRDENGKRLASADIVLNAHEEEWDPESIDYPIKACEARTLLLPSLIPLELLRRYADSIVFTSGTWTRQQTAFLEAGFGSSLEQIAVETSRRKLKRVGVILVDSHLQLTKRKAKHLITDKLKGQKLIVTGLRSRADRVFRMNSRNSEILYAIEDSIARTGVRGGSLTTEPDTMLTYARGAQTRGVDHSEKHITILDTRVRRPKFSYVPKEFTSDGYRTAEYEEKQALLNQAAMRTMACEDESGDAEEYRLLCLTGLERSEFDTSTLLNKLLPAAAEEVIVYEAGRATQAEVVDLMLRWQESKTFSKPKSKKADIIAFAKTLIAEGKSWRKAVYKKFNLDRLEKDEREKLFGEVEQVC